MVGTYLDPEYKEYLCRLIVEDQRKVSELARELNISASSLYKWSGAYKKNQSIFRPVEQEKGVEYKTATDYKKEIQKLTKEKKDLEEQNEILKKSDACLHENSGVKFQFIAAHRDLFSVKGMCTALGVSRGGFYNWLADQDREPTEAQRYREELKKKITLFFHQSFGTYGAPRIQKDVKESGYKVSERKVGRLMAELGLHACQPRKFQATTNSNHSDPVFDNLLHQNFEADKPNQVWVSDITYIWTGEGWVYLSTVMDLFSRKIVGWEITDHLRAEGPLAALEMAIVFRQPSPGLIHHSDRGSQYASKKYRAMLGSIAAKSSMSRRGTPYDNACMESFFATLKKEWVYRRYFKTKANAIRKINWFIASFYNPVRRHSKNGYLSPDKFEQVHAFIQISANYPKKMMYHCHSPLAEIS